MTLCRLDDAAADTTAPMHPHNDRMDEPRTTSPQSDSPDESRAAPATMTAGAFLTQIAQALGNRYEIVQDSAFHWLTPFGVDHERRARHAHHALRRLPELIPGLEPVPPAGGWPAILFASTEDQLAYEALFGGTGADIINGGCWRSHPVGHLAIPVHDWDALDAAFGHELVHAVLTDSGIPVWLQEGIATELETRLGHRTPPLADLYHWTTTLDYWRSHAPDPFWTAEAFHDPAASEHAYRIAQVLGYQWTRHPERLLHARTLGAQHWQDVDRALLANIGVDRASLLRAVLDPPRFRGWLERFLSWCFLGDHP
jgi:hypothetical protein